MIEVTFNIPVKSPHETKNKEILARPEWFSKILLNMGDAVIATDAKGNVAFMNKLAEELTGWNLSESAGKPIDDIFDAINEDTLLAIENPINHALKENKDILLANHTILIKKDKTKRIIVDSAVLIHDDAAEIIGGALIFRDITEQSVKQKRMEDVEGLLKGITEKVNRLKQKNKELQQFAYAVSHDLRAPIAKVLGLVSLSEIDPEFKLNDKSLLENVVNEITNLDLVVKDMSAVISVRDKFKLKEYVNFETELNLVKSILAIEIVQSKAVITTDLKEPEGIVTIKTYIYSILFNLLSNAIKYRLPATPLVIHLQTSQENGFVCFSVKDNGMGIDIKKNGDKLFGLYNRFHSEDIGGRGIGLNLVKAQVESLNGKIAVESELNKGTTFKLFFPVS